MKNKKAQTTIFVIISLLLVIIIVVLFFLYNKEITLPIRKTALPSPEKYIQSCSENAALEISDKIIKTGGYSNPEGKIFYVLHNGNKIPFLCYERNYYNPCIIQQPLLKQNAEGEIQEYVTEKTKSCFEKLKSDYEKEGYSVIFSEGNNPDIKITLSPKTVSIEINNNLILEKGEEKIKYEKIISRVSHPIYDLMDFAQDILRCESDRLCNVEAWAQGYSLYHPSKQFNSIPFDSEYGEHYGARIYEITDGKTGKKFLFAVRGYVWPPGIL